MKILILGGTQFVGRHMTQAATEGGHEVTLFNRGQTNADLFPDVEKLVGDRDGGLDALKGREWDAALDVNGYLPRIVRDSVELLKDAVGRYLFISTVSVFADFSKPGINEESPLATLEDESMEEITGEAYGGLKVLCEKAVQEVYADRATIIRPGLVVGPHDHTDRFTYWPKRIAQGGEVLAPGDPDFQVQFIDGRDLASFTLDLIEQDQAGVYNAIGPDYRLTMGELLETCVQVTGSDAELVWVDEAFLLENEVAPWMELPLWLTAEDAGMQQTDLSKVIAAGMTYTKLEDTIADTLTWRATANEDDLRPAGLDAQKEQEVLQKWKQREG